MNYDVTVGILTFNRPKGLRETLNSCLNQKNTLNLKIDIIVIDNHPSGNGKEVVDQLCRPDLRIRYVQDLSRNMSVLRNRGFLEAKAPLVAFIDDDEAAAPDWLDTLVVALHRSNAAIAVGLRSARFEASPPAYDPAGRMFIRDLQLPDLSAVELVTSWGKPRYGLGTGNSLFILDRCFGDGEPMMRESFGNAGGEDAELFARLYRNGRQIVWTSKALVTETVTPQRTTIAYRLIRTRREAQHYVSIYLDGSTRPRATYIELMFKGLVQVVIGTLIRFICFEDVSKSRIRGRLLCANGMGKLTWRRAVGYLPE